MFFYRCSCKRFFHLLGLGSHPNRSADPHWIYSLYHQHYFQHERIYCLRAHFACLRECEEWACQLCLHEQPQDFEVFWVRRAYLLYFERGRRRQQPFKSLARRSYCPASSSSSSFSSSFSSCDQAGTNTHSLLHLPLRSLELIVELSHFIWPFS